MQQQAQIKPCSDVNLFNFLQDLRHIVVFDLRPRGEYDKSFIRGSLSVFNDPSSNVAKIQHIDIKSLEYEKKYNSQHIRRFVVVGDEPQKIQEEESTITQFLDQINSKDYKLYYLNENVRQFLERYPFLSLSQDLIDEYNQLQDQDIQNLQRGNLNQNDIQKVLYAFSQFPQILIEKEIMLGSNLNANSKRQLNDMGIKSLIDLNRLSEQQQIPEDSFKRTDFSYINIPIITDIEVVLDFNEICERINELPKPVMFYCQDGNSITNGLAIAYLMWKKKMRYDLASLKVFQIRGTTNVNKSLYTQLMQYKPELAIKKS